jgi:hypothetical protein
MTGNKLQNICTVNICGMFANLTIKITRHVKIKSCASAPCHEDIWKNVSKYPCPLNFVTRWRSPASSRCGPSIPEKITPSTSWISGWVCSEACSMHGSSRKYTLQPVLDNWLQKVCKFVSDSDIWSITNKLIVPNKVANFSYKMTLCKKEITLHYDILISKLSSYQ